MTLEARYADISDQLERKGAGLRVYASQMPRLFDDEQAMLDAVAGFAARTAQAGGLGSGAAERYWERRPLLGSVVVSAAGPAASAAGHRDGRRGG